MSHIALRTVAAVIGLATASSASAEIVTFLGDKPGWDVMAGASTKLDLVGEGFEQLIAFDWYQDLNITLASKFHPAAWSWLLVKTPDGWADDGWGAKIPGSFADRLAINFDSPQHAFGYDAFSMPAMSLGLSFFSNSQLITTSYLTIPFGTPGDVRFHGWVTDFSFDRVVVEYGNYVDNIHIVPTPGAVVLLLAGVLGSLRRRPS